MLLTYNAPAAKEIWAEMSEAERAAEEAEYRDLIQSMREESIFLAAEEVEHYDAARTVRLRDGSLSVSDGPAAGSARGGRRVGRSNLCERAQSLDEADRRPSGLRDVLTPRGAVVQSMNPERGAG